MAVQLGFKQHTSHKIIVTESCSPSGDLVLMRSLSERILMAAFRRKERMEQVPVVACHTAEQLVVSPFADC